MEGSQGFPLNSKWRLFIATEPPFLLRPLNIFLVKEIFLLFGREIDWIAMFYISVILILV